jgi:uncharacterized protein (DUF736 family)
LLAFSHRVQLLRSPTSIPQQRDADLLPRRARLMPTRDFLANQEARPCAAFHFVPALRVRAGRPVFCDRHQGRDDRDLIQKRRRPMAQIGTFTRNEDGSFAGVIKTLNLNIKARLVVAEKESDKSPDLRALSGTIEIGACWKKTARETGREYHSVKLDDPSFPAPIYASLVEGEDGYALIWSR